MLATSTPKWALKLVEDAVTYLKGEGIEVTVPVLKWRHTYQKVKDPSTGVYHKCLRCSTSGTTFSDRIVINAGHLRQDTKLVLLHEFAHHVLYIQNGNLVGHTPEFWDMAWKLFKWAKLPERYCLKRERNYRKGAVDAYKRMKAKEKAK